MTDSLAASVSTSFHCCAWSSPWLTPQVLANVCSAAGLSVRYMIWGKMGKKMGSEPAAAQNHGRMRSPCRKRT